MYPRWSWRSTDSILSIASEGSILSVGSVGSVLSVGSIGSVGSLFSIGSCGSVASALSFASRGSLLSSRARNAFIGSPAGRRQRQAAAVDLALVGDLDPLGELLDAGLGLFAGAAAPTADAVRRLWRDIGFPLERLPAQVVVTPACGLAGSTPDDARRVLSMCREVARQLGEDR